MPRLNKIYTRSGDDGSTSLGNRQRVAKDNLRVEAFGSVDEANALIGLALAQNLSDPPSRMLRGIQNEMFHLGFKVTNKMLMPVNVHDRNSESSSLIFLAKDGKTLPKGDYVAESTATMRIMSETGNELHLSEYPGSL